MLTSIKAALISCLFLFPAFSEVIKDEVKVVSKTKHDFKKVCSFLLKKDPPLIEEISKTTLDCMSKKVNVVDYCLKAYPTDPYISRGYIEKKQVICLSARSVHFKYRCRRKDSLCSTAEETCSNLKKNLANRLELEQFYLIENEKKEKIVSCYYRPPRPRVKL